MMLISRIKDYLKKRRERKERMKRLAKERGERIERRVKVYEMMFTDAYLKDPFGFLLNPSEDARKLAELAENPAGMYLLDGKPVVISDVPTFDGFSFHYHTTGLESSLGWDEADKRCQTQ